MGTAQTERSPVDMLFGDSTSIATMSSDVATLRVHIQSGNIIYASHVSKLTGMVNTMLGHYHRYNDAEQLATYGNNGDRVNYWSNNKSTTQIAGYDTVFPLSGDTIRVSHHNNSATRVNNIITHSHSIDDYTVNTP